MILKKLPIILTIFSALWGRAASLIKSPVKMISFCKISWVFQNSKARLIYFLELPTSTKIIAAIQLLSVNKAIDHGQIPPCYLRIAADVIAPYMQYLLSFLFIEGIFPESCTIAKVILLYKKKVIKLIPLTTALLNYFLLFQNPWTPNVIQIHQAFF